MFGWHIRQRGDGTTAFDDGVGEVSGTWRIGRPPATMPGLLVYVMVDNVAPPSSLLWLTEVKLYNRSAPMPPRSRPDFAIREGMCLASTSSQHEIFLISLDLHENLASWAGLVVFSGCN